MGSGGAGVGGGRSGSGPRLFIDHLVGATGTIPATPIRKLTQVTRIGHISRFRVITIEDAFGAYPNPSVGNLEEPVAEDDLNLPFIGPVNNEAVSVNRHRCTELPEPLEHPISILESHPLLVLDGLHLLAFFVDSFNHGLPYSHFAYSAHDSPQYR